MKKTLRLPLIFSLLFLLTVSGYSQDKQYGNIYISIKNGDDWGGLKKVAATAKLVKFRQEPAITLFVSDGKSLDYTITCQFEAKTGDGKAFHKIMSGNAAYPANKWVSPSGNSVVTWVYFNKAVDEIHSGVAKPFDVELQFADGSAVKYFISPAY